MFDIENIKFTERRRPTNRVLASRPICLISFVKVGFQFGFKLLLFINFSFLQTSGQNRGIDDTTYY